MARNNLIVLPNGVKVPSHCNPNDFVDFDDITSETLSSIVDTKIITTPDENFRNRLVFNNKDTGLMLQYKTHWFQCPEDKLEKTKQILSNGRESLLVSNQEIVDNGRKLCFYYDQRYGTINGSFHTGYAMATIDVPTQRVVTKKRGDQPYIPTYRLIIWDSELEQIKDLFRCAELEGERQ